jgi:hypothetical protein
MAVGRPSTDRSRPRPPPTLLHEIHLDCRSRCRHLSKLLRSPSRVETSCLTSSRVLIASWLTRNHLLSTNSG